MCFMVDKNARRPKIKTVYKIMKLGYSPGGNYLYSLVRRTRLRWAPNDVMTALPGGVPSSWGDPYTDYSGNFAAAGIYVYDNFREAERVRCFFNAAVVVVMEVDPDDWLYSSDDMECMYGRIHTYKKAKIAPIRRQKEIEYP